MIDDERVIEADTGEARRRCAGPGLVALAQGEQDTSPGPKISKATHIYLGWTQFGLIRFSLNTEIKIGTF